MLIGIAGPMTIAELELRTGENVTLPPGYDFPLISWLINALLDRGYEVVAFTTSQGIDHPVVLKGGGLTLCIGKMRPFHRARDMYKFERKELQRLMKSHKVDVIGAHWSYEFAWAALDTGIPTLVSLHDHAFTVLRFSPDAYRFVRLLMNNIVISRARWLSVNSPYLLNLLSRKHQRKALIIPNFFPRKMSNLWNSYAQRENMIVTVANGFWGRKNVGTAIKAYAILRRRYPDLHYCLVGNDMEPEGPAERYARERGICEGITFVGRIPPAGVMNLVRNARVIVHPSREESFGMSVLEAMVIGTPVVGGEGSGNIPALLDNGHAGRLCDVNSPEAIAEEVSTLLSDRGLSAQLAVKARDYANEHFSEEKIVDSYVRHLHEIYQASGTVL